MIKEAMWLNELRLNGSAIFIQRAWVQSPLAPITVTGGSRNGIQPKLLLYARKVQFCMWTRHNLHNDGVHNGKDH